MFMPCCCRKDLLSNPGGAKRLEWLNINCKCRSPNYNFRLKGWRRHTCFLRVTWKKSPRFWGARVARSLHVRDWTSWHSRPKNTWLRAMFSKGVSPLVLPYVNIVSVNMSEKNDAWTSPASVRHREGNTSIYGRKTIISQEIQGHVSFTVITEKQKGIHLFTSHPNVTYFFVL